MKIIGITMVTDPEYRQDPWKECIGQMLEICDEAVVVCGDTGTYDLADQMKARFDKPLHFEYLDWPQPEWTYDELARHLNAGLVKARELNADWVIKFDADYFIHEQDAGVVKAKLRELKAKKKAIGAFEKLQFFQVSRAYEKGNILTALNMEYPIWYGKDKAKYTDLCQPILWDGKSWMRYPGAAHEIPEGVAVPENLHQRMGVHVWNYDYSFKTLERATELLYRFDRSHAKFWGHGYHGKALKDITPESALRDYITLVTGRLKKCNKTFEWQQHPRHIRERVRDIDHDKFGYLLWNKI
jgi:hypothetical protein